MTTATLTHQIDAFDKQYNGWTNYETWNVALWIENDEGLYHTAREAGSYEDLLEVLYTCGSKRTPDGVSWTDPKVNRAELNADVFDY